MEERSAFVRLVDYYVRKITLRLGFFEAGLIFSKAASQGPLSTCKLTENGFNYRDGPTARCLDTASQSGEIGSLSPLIEKLYQEYTALLGEGVAGRDLESSVGEVSQEAKGDIPASLLRALPMGVMETQKTKLLSREELETLVGERTQALQEAKNNLEKTVEKRTSLLKAETNKLRSIVDSVSDGIIVTDRQTQIVVFNGVASRLTGFPVNEAIGKKVEEVLRLFENEKLIDVGTFCPIAEVQTDKILFSQKGLRAETRRGLIHLDVDSSAILEGSQVGIGCILTLRDVTKEKELENMKLDFVSIAAHELRTPLTSIRGYLEVFLEENGEKFDKEQAMFLERIRVSAQQLSALVDNLLSASGIERGALTIHPAPLSWPEVVGQIVSSLQEVAREKGIDLKFLDPEKEYPPVTADKVRISEVLDNLLVNGLNYTPRGGHVSVRVEKQENGLVTRVQNDGPGIPEEALPKLFTKFFRVRERLDETSQGLGLGLYLSKAIVELHQGRIWVESKPNEGSTFSFFLPFKQNTNTVLE